MRYNQNIRIREASGLIGGLLLLGILFLLTSAQAQTPITDYAPVQQFPVSTPTLDQTGSNVIDDACTSVHFQTGFHYAAKSTLSLHASVICSETYEPGFPATGTIPQPNGAPTTLNPRLAVGTTPGTFHVSQTGAATYMVSLQMPPGTKGMQPNLSVNYNSHGSNGLMGVGWSLGGFGLSTITRAPQNLYYDNSVSPVSLTGNDRFILDGARLMPTTAGSYGDVGMTYETEAESFSIITSVGGTSGNPNYFTIKTKDGSTLEYGNLESGTNSYLASNGGTTPALFWALDKVTDIYGNYMNIYYIQDENGFRLDRIDYTGNGSLKPYNEVKCVYGDLRQDPQVSYVAGYPVKTNFLLSAVEMYAQGAKVHEYDFNYADDPTTGSQLSEVIELGTDQTQYNSTKIDWSNSLNTNAGVQPYSNTSYAAQYNFKNGGYSSSLPSSPIQYTGDFNGDGLTDILVIQDPNTITASGTAVLSLNNGNGGFSNETATTYTLPSAGVSSVALIKGRQDITIDLNGDGLDDMLIYYADGKGADFYLPFFSSLTGLKTTGNVPNCQLQQQSSLQVQGRGASGAGTTSGSNHYIIGDFDGDGTKDLFVYYDALNITEPNSFIFQSYAPGKGQHQSQGSLYNAIGTNLVGQSGGLTNIVFDKKVTLTALDIDGDGKDEILFTDGNYSVIYDLAISTDLSSVGLVQVSGTNTYPSVNDTIVNTGDFNGDGNADLLTFNVQSQKFEIGYATAGNYGLQYTAFKAPPIPAQSTYSDGHKNKLPNYGYVVADFNGDGRTDIGVITLDVFPTSANPLAQIIVNTYSSLGNNLWSALPGYEFSTAWYPADGSSYGDFDGDGHTDIMLPVSTAISAYGDILYTQTSSRHGAQPIYSDYNMVTGITNGLNTNISIDYNTLPELAYKMNNNLSTENTYQIGTTAATCNCNLMDVQNANSVVSEIKIDDGLQGKNTSQYGYTGAQVHRQGKGFLGFLGTTINDDTRSMQVQNVYYPHNPGNFFQSLLNTSQTSSTTLGSIDLKTYSYKTQNLVSTAPLCYYTFLNTLTNNDQLHGNTSTTTINQDNYGNPASILTNDGAGIQTITTNNFVNTNFPPSQLTYSIFTRTGYSGTYSRRMDYADFNSANQPQTITTDFGNTISATTVTTLKYDNFGNLISSITTGDKITDAPNTNNTYEPLGRYVAKQTKTASNIPITNTFTYDNAYGNLLSKTDPNGLLTQYGYDGFGRLIQTITPTNQVITNTYSWTGTGTTNPANSLFTITTSGPGMPTSTNYYDQLSRTLRQQTIGFDGSTNINVDQIYNTLGQLQAKTEPYSPGGTIESNIFVYDAVFRPYFTLTSGGANIGFAYSGNTTTTTTTSGSGTRTVAKTLDASGQLISVRDDGGLLSYTYHNCLKPVTISNSDGSQVTMNYDNLGRQTSLSDPDAGTMNYDSYDALGEILSQTDSKGNNHKFTYDALGRKLTSTGLGTEGTTTFTYDQQPHGIGMIGKITNDGTLLTGNQTYTYDNFSRIQSKKETMPDGDYTTNYTFNNLNQLTNLSYPNPHNFSTNPFALSYTYSTLGYLQSINTASSANPIWICKTMNEHNQVTKSTNGAMGSTNKSYDDLGNLTRINAIETPGTAMDYSYTWDRTNGNLTSRTSSAGLNHSANPSSLLETFTYDNLDRLQNENVNGAQTPATTYNANGNIATKNDAASGTFNYQALQPHAVSSIQNPTAALSPNTQNITYTPFLMPATIVQGPSATPALNEVDYQYGLDYKRKTSTSKLNSAIQSTTVYSDNFEKISTPSTNTIYEVHYIQVPDGLTAINVRTNNAPDQDNIYYVHTDHLGSIINLYDPSTSTVICEQNFDAWGRQRDPNNNFVYPSTPLPSKPWLIRGFSGHEMLPQFGLINMNARMYDPVIGRMLSPDNFVQSADYTQDYNRYSYALNNPLKFTDPSGNLRYRYQQALQGWQVGSYEDGGNAFHGSGGGGGGLSGFTDLGGWQEQQDAMYQAGKFLQIFNQWVQQMNAIQTIPAPNATDPNNGGGPPTASLEGAAPFIPNGLKVNAYYGFLGTVGGTPVGGVKIDISYTIPTGVQDANWMQMVSDNSTNGEKVFDCSDACPFYYSGNYVQSNQIIGNTISFFDQPYNSNTDSFRASLALFQNGQIIFSLSYGYDYNKTNNIVTPIPIRVFH